MCEYMHLSMHVFYEMYLYIVYYLNMENGYDIRVCEMYLCKYIRMVDFLLLTLRKNIVLHTVAPYDRKR